MKGYSEKCATEVVVSLYKQGTMCLLKPTWYTLGHC